MALTLKLPPAKERTEFNTKRWAELLADPELARLAYRIETDRHGHILMSPPPAASHGRKQNRIGTILEQLLPDGHTITECPLSTADGVKAIDVAWLAPHRADEAESVLLTRAPEICVEIFSPSNTRSEIEEKIALYFEAGAQEIWVCALDGKMTFYAAPNIRGSSGICPQFPSAIRF